MVDACEQSGKRFDQGSADIITVGDREADIYEMFLKAEETKQFFLVRCARQRLVLEEGLVTEYPNMMNVYKNMDVRQIDQLVYFARTENPLAHDSIKALALWPVSWTPEGQLVNGVEANITFEAFDIYS